MLLNFWRAKLNSCKSTKNSCSSSLAFFIWSFSPSRALSFKAFFSEAKLWAFWFNSLAFWSLSCLKLCCSWAFWCSCSTWSSRIFSCAVSSSSCCLLSLSFKDSWRSESWVAFMLSMICLPIKLSSPLSALLRLPWLSLDLRTHSLSLTPSKCCWSEFMDCLWESFRLFSVWRSKSSSSSLFLMLLQVSEKTFLVYSCLFFTIENWDFLSIKSLLRVCKLEFIEELSSSPKDSSYKLTSDISL
mmetsp:Transcript_15252/g.22177  ORF Transcript_15252/g.22177 Transcript_15252/m.22177 type:complete len:243 (-) Transcript_15252:1119-1847(-)